MKISKLIAIFTACLLTATFLAGCKKNKKNSKESSAVSYDSSSYDDSSLQTSTSATTETTPVETFPDYPISYPQIIPQDTGTIYQAEDCDCTGLTPTNTRKGFSGTAYVSGFDKGTNSLTFNISAPSTQHYDFGFSIASDKVTKCSVSVNDKTIGDFNTIANGKFTLVKMYGIFLTQGNSTIKITVNSGNIDLDYLQLTNNTSLSKISYDTKGTLTNQNSDKNTKELMSFLSEQYGSSIISGQYVSDSSNKELDLVYRTTGKYPVIRFSELDSSYMSLDDSFNDIEAAADWYRQGGIVGLMWQWKAPSSKSSVYAADTDFKLSKAVTNTDISSLSQEQIRALYGEGKISKECYGIILDIDNMAGKLLSLKSLGIPVLWRPLHEAGGNWFWWGADGVSSYKWLWNLMYSRMTNYFKLDNLIWVWNGQSAECLVDKNTFDIASVDIYMNKDKDFGSRYEQFAAIQKMVGKDKLIAISECSRIPDVDDSFRDNAVWSFFGLWYGSYVSKNGKFSEEYIKKDAFIKAYNSEGVMTLDEYRKLTGYGGNTPVTATKPVVSSPPATTAVTAASTAPASSTATTSTVTAATAAASST